MNGETVKDARDLSKRIGMMKPAPRGPHRGARRQADERGPQAGAASSDQQIASASEKDSVGTDVPRLGLQLAPAKSVQGAGNEGVVVTEVDPKGAAAQRGIRSGDVILDVGGKAVSTPQDVREGLAAAKAENRKAVLMRVKGEQGVRFVAITISDKAG